MKAFVHYTVIGLMILLSSCGSRTNRGVNYNPSDRSKFSSKEEKALAIAQKKAEAAGILSNSDYKNAVKLNVMVPKVEEDFPLPAAQTLTMKLLQITAANGIAGYGGDPAFVIAALANPVKEGITNTIPKKNFINFILTLYVANIHSGDVFGVLEQEVMGVGDSKELAVINAMESVNNNEAIAQLLRESSQKIVSWFEDHSDAFVAEVKHYMRSGAYDKAYGLLASVPEAATSCFKFAQENMDAVHEMYLSQLSKSYYQRMKDAIAAANGEYNPEVGACMSMIPENSSVYKDAVAMFDKYVASVAEIGNAKRAHDMYMEEETIAVEKLRLESEIKAQEALMNDMEARNDMVSRGGIEGFAGNFLNNVGNSITTMLVDKAESLVLGGVSTLLSFI